MRILKVICDGCGRDLTTAENDLGYRLALVVESIYPKSGLVTSTPTPRPIDDNAHFCRVECVTRWIAAREQKEKADEVQTATEQL